MRTVASRRARKHIVTKYELDANEPYVSVAGFVILKERLFAELPKDYVSAVAFLGSYWAASDGGKVKIKGIPDGVSRAFLKLE